MKNIKSILIVFALVISATACKQKISYTRDVLKRYHLTESEIDKLQYYLENDVVLYNGTKDGSTELVDGEIVINEEENTDKIIFRSGTKGILEKSLSPNKISIRFENGDGRFLVFGSSSLKGRYTLQAEKWTEKEKWTQTKQLMVCLMLLFDSTQVKICQQHDFDISTIYDS